MFRSFSRFFNNLGLSANVGFFLATRSIRRSSKWTTSLIIFIMVLTFLNLVVVSGLLVGLIQGSFQQFQEKYSGEILITPAPGREYIEGSPRIVEYLKAHRDVQSISPRYSKLASILGTLSDNPRVGEKPNQAGGAIIGLDPELEEKVTGFSSNILVGTNLSKGDEGYILVGSNLIKKYSSFADIDIPGLELLKDVEVGNRVRVTLTGDSATPVSKDFVVKGIVKSKVDQVSTRFFVLDTELRRMLQTNEYELNEISIRTDQDRAKQLSEEFKTFINNSRVRVQTTEEALPSFLRQVELTFNILGNALSSIALVVATITVFIVVFINAVTRRKFIGIMKGIGISPGAIKMSYVFQSIFYGVCGSVIGLVLTFGFLKPYFDANPIDFPFSDGILVATPEGSVIRVAILILVTILAGYIPSRMIVRKNTLDSILGR